MKLVRAMPRALQAIAILFFGPLLGILIAFVLAALALRTDPNIVANGGHTAPGDGILVLLYAFISLVVSIPLSIWGAVVVLLRSKNEIGRRPQQSAVSGVS
jgi:hypothetical protein